MMKHNLLLDGCRKIVIFANVLKMIRSSIQQIQNE